MKDASDSQLRTDILAALDALGSRNVQDDTLTFEGDRFVVPAGMTARAAADFLREWEEQQETTFAYSRDFPYRPYDGAAAFDRALKRVFGSVGIGRATFSLFGSRPPRLISIPTSPTTTAQVPWEQVEMPLLDATFYLTAARSRDSGNVFQLQVEAPRKYRQRIEGFFDVVADELAQRSLYRGHAITGGSEPTFLDLTGIDPDRVVYSAETMTQLQANLWSLVQYPQVMRDLGIPLKRAVLMEGPWGTGKTMAGALTGRLATANGWTYILARPGQDDLLETMRTARMYAPSVVWFEDIDVEASDATSRYIAQLLDALDGVSAKGAEIIVGFTTNHVERIARGMLRPGRIDSVIHFGELDRADVRRFVETNVATNYLDLDIDWDEVARAFDGYVPAFAREAIDRALRYRIARTGSAGAIGTYDLVHAANGLRSQLALMDGASEGVRGESLDLALRRVVGSTVVDLLTTLPLPHHGDAFVVDDETSKALDL